MADRIDPDACPGAAEHGNPFRYCTVEGCGWPEEPEPIHPHTIDVGEVTVGEPLGERGCDALAGGEVTQ